MVRLIFRAPKIRVNVYAAAMPKLTIDWSDFEMACEPPTGARSYLDLETGAVFVLFDETAEELQELLAEAGPDVPVDSLIALADAPDWQKEALRNAWHVEEYLGERVTPLEDGDFRDEFRDLEDFTATVEDAGVRRQLEQAIRGHGAFRRFRDIIHGCFRERKLWFVFKARRQREKAERWLASRGVEVEWVMPEVPADFVPPPPPRQHLLAGVLKFTRAAAQLPGCPGLIVRILCQETVVVFEVRPAAGGEGTLPPERPVPLPRVTTATRCSLASLRIAAISPALRGNTTARGSCFSVAVPSKA